MLRLNHFSFRYQAEAPFALLDLNLQIRPGEFVGVIGNSGAGKTTLTYALNGVIPHHYDGEFFGEVVVDGYDTVTTPLETLSRMTGSVFQDIDSQMVAAVVEDEILFGLENFGVPREVMAQKVDECLEQVGISHLRQRNIRTLSGGQKQKLAIAAVTALSPKLLILDEPTGELDPQSSRQIFEMLRQLNQEQGVTIVVVEQKIALLAEFAHRLLVLQQGQVMLDGSVAQILSEPEKLNACGVHCPRIATLANRLTEMGYYQGTIPRNLDEAAAMVEEVLA